MKINELKLGKPYKSKLSGTIYKIDKNKKLLLREKNGEWVESSLAYNTCLEMNFEEAKYTIDWTKVPRGTKVNVKDNLLSNFVNRYFQGYNEDSTNKFLASLVNDDEFTGLSGENNSLSWRVCKLDESVEIKDEWIQYL